MTRGKQNGVPAPPPGPPPLESVLRRLGETAARPMESATGLPPEVYWREDFAALEREKIFRRDWACPGLAADIPEAGDCLTFSAAGEPVFCVRDRRGKIRTFANVCRHRMMRLVQDGGGRLGKRIVCPYHAWTYDLDGRLVGAGHMKDSAGFDKSGICLPEVRTEIWHGWIYITLNPDAPPVRELLAPLEEAVGRYGMADYAPVARQDHVWRTNWKLLTENFMEGYHLPVAHKATVGAWFPAGKTRFPGRRFDAFTYQTFVKSEAATYGRAHAANKRLEGEWRRTSALPTVFPCHMYMLAPDHLWYLSLRPRGVDEVDVRFGAALAPEVRAELDDADGWISELLRFFGEVNEEDRFVVEGVHAGARSGFAAPGPLSWLEREIHDFQRYLARRLADGLAPPPRAVL